MTDPDSLDRAARAIRAGELVVYPTETVYGLGGDALDPAAVERVFEAKKRDRSKPISMAVPDIETAHRYTNPTERELAFMERFLPGPVTVVLERSEQVPTVLTAGRERVGVRIPDHETALALLERAAPLTATSANVSGRPGVRAVSTLDSHISKAVSVVLDGSETAGGGSTVVDVDAGTIYRRGERAGEIERWLDG